MGSLSIGHWILLALIILFFFGRTNLAQLGRNLGRGIRGFKEGLSEIDSETREVVDELTHDKNETQAERQKQKSGHPEGKA